MLSIKSQLIALVVVLVMAQVAFADDENYDKEVIAGGYYCHSSLTRISVQGTSGILATGDQYNGEFNCTGAGSENCGDNAITFATLLEARGCAAGPIADYAPTFSMNFVCKGKRNRVVSTLGDLCISIMKPNPAP